MEKNAGNEITRTVLDGLNEPQQQAVQALHGPVLIVAGPGAGKTKTLTHRIVYMLASGIRPRNILAVTFTNKAAQEMKDRIASLIPDKRFALSRLTIGTFHSLCARTLRREARHLGYTRGFTIYDSDDQLNAIKNALNAMNIDPKRFSIYAIRSRISDLKTRSVSPQAYDKEALSYFEKTVAQVYTSYQDVLKRSNAMDFDDLIMNTIRLFKENPKILERYQNMYTHILVDEYQDTDAAQYALIRMLSRTHRNLFAIGDTDQTVYSWRGADFRNMLNFEKDFSDARVIFLEQNYRSNAPILAAAQHLIEKNMYRHPKKLWTDKRQGDKPTVKPLYNELEEGLFIAGTIRELLKNKHVLKDFVILYRTHAQSRVLEEIFMQEGFPYTIVGGVRFYERREIKDILAYLKLLANPHDAISMHRISNIPPRGIGKVTLLKITEFAHKHNVDFLTALNQCVPARPTRASDKKIASFASQLNKVHAQLPKCSLFQLAKYIIETVGYQKYIDNGTEEGEMRWENVKELFTVIKAYGTEPAEATLAPFLENVALIQETDKVEKGKDVIHMMTLHSAKGLEFPVVFIAGLEDGLLPHARSITNPAQLEEERRLLYVGITRAKEKLYLTLTHERSIFGSTQFNIPSRFLQEIPEDALEGEWMNDQTI